MPETPLRTVQGANRVVGEGRVSRARAEAAGRLQRVLKAHGRVPPQSSTIVALGSTSRCNRHSPASPSHSTVAGVSACTPAVASACLNAAAEAA
jgi:hypothetical protein